MKKKLIILTGLIILLAGNCIYSQTKNNINYIEQCLKEKNNKKVSLFNTSFVEINISTFKKNIKFVKKFIGKDVKFCAVLKSDAYGFGLKGLIQTVIDQKPDYIAAINNSDFKFIHKLLQKKKENIPFIRLAPPLMQEVIESQIYNYGIEEIVGSLNEAKMLSETAFALSKKLKRKVVIPIHINIETGMGRMGVRSPDEINTIMQMPNLKLKGIMTHFARVYDFADGAEMTKQQTKKFDNITGSLHLDKNIIKHIASSGASVLYPETRKDMVRIGSLLYGEDIEGCNPDNMLVSIFQSLKSYVAIIEKNVPPNSPIGYSSAATTPPGKLSNTATIRVGYDNNYPLLKSFKIGTHVLIKGKKFPVIGNPSMNLTIIDITNQDKNNPIEVGDEVVLIGKQGNEEITIRDVAEKNNLTITELLMNICKTNPRVYVK